MRKFLAFGVSAAISMLAGSLASAEPIKPKTGLDKPRTGAGAASRGSSSKLEPAASQAETADDAEARSIQAEDERKATQSKEKMKKRPGYKNEVPSPRA